MKRTRRSPEQFAAKLHQAATELAGGETIEEVCKSRGISPATHHRWREQYGGAGLSLDKVALQELLEGKGQARRANDAEDE